MRTTLPEPNKNLYPRKVGNVIYMRDMRLSDASCAFFTGAGFASVILLWMIITTCLQFKGF